MSDDTLSDLYIPTHDEHARHAFIGALKAQVNGPVEENLAEFYTTDIGPAFEAEHGRGPKHRDEVIPAFESTPLYQTWGSMVYTSQDLMWETVGDTVDRLHPAFEARARAILRSDARLGSLELNPELELPAPIVDVDIHRQPGGYFFESSEQDLTTGMLYMGAIELYRTAKGLGADVRPGDPGRGRRIVKFVDDNFPGLEPRRILDMGCAIGTETVAYKERWPGAEVHGLDLSAPFLRFAHIWAEDHDCELHFHQQNAAETSFPDGYFDLIVSHIMFHETWFDIQDRIMAEARRLLSAGGCFINMDVPYQPDAIPMTKQVTNAWQVKNNGEPYWTGFADRDVRADLAEAGFPYDATFGKYEPVGRAVSYFFGASKPR
jgi:SAM-dependent methyltransferase